MIYDIKKKCYIFLVSILFFLIVISENCFGAFSKFDYDYLTGDYEFNLPSEYTSTSQGIVTSVKVQGHSGPCWSFGIISALESNYLKQNDLRITKNWEIDFSEMNLVYNLNSGASLSNPYEFDFAQSGNNEMASAYFSSGRGPVLEGDDPYKSDYHARDYKENFKKPLKKYIRQIIYIPDVDKFDSLSERNHRELVKKFVLENGSVATNIFWDENYLDSSEENYFYNSYSSTTNHTAAIVGWDDNYSRENFNSNNKPENDGAFIIKNSWGKDKHDSGFFYMSYDDKFAGFNSYVMNEIVDEQEKYRFENIYQHDYFGMIGAIDINILGDKKNICSVFDLRNEKENLSDIGIFVASNNVSCKFFLLKISDDNKIIGYSDSFYDANFEFPGYYVISLPNKILLSDKKFGIGIKMSGKNLFIPCEKNEAGFLSKAVSLPNQNFYGNEYGFEDFYEKVYGVTNFCIKAFTEKSADDGITISYHKFLQNPQTSIQIPKTTDVQNYEYEQPKIKSFTSFDKFIFVIIVFPIVAVLLSYKFRDGM